MPEAQSAGLADGQGGSLSAAGFPERPLALQVSRVEPTAALSGLTNVVRVHAALAEPAPAWLRPGMQGAASITTGRGSLLHAWTRGPINWLRQRFWL